MSEQSDQGWGDKIEKEVPLYNFQGHLMRDGFAPIPHTLIRTKRLRPYAKLVLYLMISRADKNGESFPGREGMGEDLSLSPNSIKDALNELRDFGLISWHRRGQGKTNIYLVHEEGISAFIAAEMEIKTRATEPSENPDLHLIPIKTFTRRSSKSSPGARKEEPVEEHPVEEEPVHVRTLGASQFPTNKNGETEDARVWPDWYATLYSLPGFKRPLALCEEWLQSKGITFDLAETTAYALKGKWSAKKYSDVWATFQNWCKLEVRREPATVGPRTIRTSPRPAAARDWEDEARRLGRYARGETDQI